jgi:hypothetical protein
MKSSLFRSLSLSAVILAVFVHGSFAQCSLTDNSRDAVFITFERTAEVKLDGREKLQPGVVLRLHNNSSCAVLIETGSAQKFYKPLPPDPTPLQRLRREVDHELPNGVLVPDVQYRYRTRNSSGMSVGGDMFFWFELVGGRSVLFEVPLSHLDVQAAGIELRFRYAWEHSNRARTNHASTENIVRFGSSGLPDDVKRQVENNNR